MPDPDTVRDLFAAVAKRYDLLNHTLSLGIDRLWRRRLVRHSGITDGARVLDVCAGTGDIILAFLSDGRCGRIVGVDFSTEMLSAAKHKITGRKGGRIAALVGGDVLSLPFGDGMFDIVTMGFGLRNLADYGRGIREAARVLVPGGRLLVLEFAPPKGRLFLLPYRLYLGLLVPIIGGLLTGRREAYRHLSDTIAGFLTPDEVLSIMNESGLTERAALPQTWGIAYLYGSRKPEGAAAIVGRTVTIRAMSPDDIPEFYRMAAQSDSTPFWWGEIYGDSVPAYEDFLTEYPIHYFTGESPEKGRCFFIITGGRKIGAVAYNGIDGNDRSVELDVIIADNADTGRGYGSDALEALSRYLFDTMGVSSCFIIPIASNKRAIRAYQKAGFRAVKSFVEDGRKYVYFELTKSSVL